MEDPRPRALAPLDRGDATRVRAVAAQDAVSWSPPTPTSAQDSAPDLTDAALGPLVDAARDGDQEAFGQLVEATYRQTYTLALRLTGNPEDARDVTQDAYLRAHRGLSSFRGDARFSTWMYRVTANSAATYLGRRNRNRHEQLPSPSEVVDLRPDHDPQLRADAAALRDQLLVALDGLSPKLRSVVVLRDVYELSHEDIAEELGISVTAAKVRLHRARAKLRAEVFPELDEVGARAI